MLTKAVDGFVMEVENELESDFDEPPALEFAVLLQTEAEAEPVAEAEV